MNIFKNKNKHTSSNLLIIFLSACLNSTNCGGLISRVYGYFLIFLDCFLSWFGSLQMVRIIRSYSVFSYSNLRFERIHEYHYCLSFFVNKLDYCEFILTFVTFSIVIHNFQEHLSGMLFWYSK